MLSNIPAEVLSLLTYLLAGKTGISEDDKKYALSKASEYICNYCSLTAVPKQVYNTWCDMAISILKVKVPSSFTDDEEGSPTIADVTSVNVGDTSLNLGSKKSEVRATIDLENAMISMYKAQLHKVRGMSL